VVGRVLVGKGVLAVSAVGGDSNTPGDQLELDEFPDPGAARRSWLEADRARLVEHLNREPEPEETLADMLLQYTKEEIEEAISDSRVVELLEEDKRN
jgi:hypothetical protein